MKGVNGNKNKKGRVGAISNLQNHPAAFVTASDLAAYWGVSRKHVYKQIEAGTLEALRLGPRSLRIRTADAIHFEYLAKMSSHSSREPRTRAIQARRRSAPAASAANDTKTRRTNQAGRK